MQFHQQAMIVAGIIGHLYVYTKGNLPAPAEDSARAFSNYMESAYLHALKGKQLSQAIAPKQSTASIQQEKSD